MSFFKSLRSAASETPASVTPGTIAPMRDTGLDVSLALAEANRHEMQVTEYKAAIEVACRRNADDLYKALRDLGAGGANKFEVNKLGGEDHYLLTTSVKKLRDGYFGYLCIKVAPPEGYQRNGTTTCVLTVDFVNGGYNPYSAIKPGAYMSASNTFHDEPNLPGKAAQNALNDFAIKAAGLGS